MDLHSVHTRWTAWVQRTAQTLRYYAQGVVSRFMKEDVFIWSGAIAFKVLVTFFPLLILAAGIFGLVLNREEVFSTISDLILTFAPPYQSQQIIDTLIAFAEVGNTVTIIGSIGLMVTVVTLLTTLRLVVGNVFWRTHKKRSILWGYLFDARMALQCGLLFLLTFGLTVAMNILGGTGNEVLDWLNVGDTWARRSWGDLIRGIGLLVPFVITTTLFFQLYFFIPRPHPRKFSALTGALVAGIFWELAKQLFAFYAVRFGGFDRYSGVNVGRSDLGAIGEFMGLLLALVFWTYYSGLVFIVGAFVSALRDERASKLPNRVKVVAEGLPAATAEEVASAGSPKPVPPPVAAQKEAAEA